MNSRRREQIAALQKQVDTLRSQLASAIESAHNMRDELSDISVDVWHSADRASEQMQYERWKAVNGAADKLDRALSMINAIAVDLENTASRANMLSMVLSEARQKIFLKIV